MQHVHIPAGRLKTLKLFSRRTKRASTDSHHSASASVTSPRDFNLPNSKVPEIDEEGYSIRPVDADRITGFGDNKEAQSSSDSESDDGKLNCSNYSYNTDCCKVS